MSKIEVIEFIAENYLVLVPVVWVLGKFLKGTPKIPDWTIPLLTLGVSVVFSIATALNIELLEAFKQGVLIAGLAVFGNELLQQTFVKRKTDSQ